MNLDYLVREPENITSQTPILFMLHGYGSNEQDLFSFRETLPNDWIIVSFRAPRDTQFEGYSWYDINFNDPENFIDVPQAEESLHAVLESMLKIINHYGLTESKAHLCGFSQGGILCYALALKHPELFNRVACMSSYPEDKILDGIVKDKKKLEGLRFFISHGTDDAVIPLEWGRKAADLLYDLSCYFTFREYMSGHGVNQKNYMDLMDFFSK
ncbi:phospholipase/carboxylesterase [Chryseobacterium vietnamense]|uniref:Phospholipase/carboxylesterase n=1 Tax=Chryseobacterium vietnamense TaxID=866785 RepID=A0ACC6J218_9FLAO|nr:alpha/beta fold hydrolase [Chryseobacterium vietnamense]MDR6456928.1 phospholipase/carboxylesterase [Chryseobacterium vietnamense]MDR6485592.1 phospholipase/carboxylesterase [Chryseobacterium vietnamense]